MKLINVIGGIGLTLSALSIQAATIDGVIIPTGGEYQYSTEGAEGNSKWNTHGGVNEYNDGSGGNTYDINYLGISTDNGKFQFGAVGGDILSGRAMSPANNIYLSDFAISVGSHTDPTLDSSGFEYAVRLLNVDDNTGVANFSLLTGGNWVGTNLYNNAYAPDYISDTYRMNGGTELALFSGQWSNNGTDMSVLEGEFDLSLLSLLNTSVASSIHTYLSMTCVNDEALVSADVAAVPVPAAVWLFGSALLGLTGFKKRKTI